MFYKAILVFYPCLDLKVVEYGIVQELDRVYSYTNVYDGSDESGIYSVGTSPKKAINNLLQYYKKDLIDLQTEEKRIKHNIDYLTAKISEEYERGE